VGEHEFNSVIQRFLEAIETGSESVLREVYSDKVQVWHNFTNASLSKEPGIALLMGLFRDGVRLRYVFEEQLVVGNRGVRRHRVEATRPDGQRFEIRVAMFATIEAGQIVHLDEYVDSKELEPLAGGVKTLLSKSAH
jgi:ketosteroid isomerase-like protein